LQIHFDDLVTEFLVKYPQNHLIFSTIGKPGKSSQTILRFLKTCPLIRDNRISISVGYQELESQILEKKNSVIVFFDDFFASGGTIMTHLQGGRENDTPYLPLLQAHFPKRISKIIFSAVISMEDAKKKLELTNIALELHAKIHQKALDGNPPLISKVDLVTRIRELCLKYAPKYDWKQPFGYENSQSLVSFEHGCPNNTFPLFWFDKKGWKCLFPRDAGSKLSEAKERNKVLALEMAAFAWGIKSKKTFGKLTSQNAQQRFRLTALLKYLHQGKSLRDANKDFCIGSEDLETLLRIGREEGTISQSNSITQLGRDQITQILSSTEPEKALAQRLRVGSLEFGSYIPTDFNGKGLGSND
jgi:hypothetical protein